MKKIVKLKNGCQIQTTSNDVTTDPIIKMMIEVNKTEIIEIIEVSA